MLLIVIKNFKEINLKKAQNFKWLKIKHSIIQLLKFFAYQLLIIVNGAFNQCEKFMKIEFPSDTNLQKIENEAFNWTFVENLAISSNSFIDHHIQNKISY